MDYTKLKETRKDVKQHDESLERHDHLIEDIQEKLGEQMSISSPLVEVIIGIFLTLKKCILALEAKLANLKQTIIYLVNQ
jgi:hypothetical protein